jgi:hypothetical protein
MKKILILLFILPLFNNVSAQDWKFNSNGGSIKGSFDGSNSPTQSFDEKFHIDPLKKTPDSKEKPGKDKPTPPLKDNYDGPASEGSWGENDTYSNGLYERMKNKVGWYKYDREAFSILDEVNSMLSSDCIDIHLLHNAYVKFKGLSSFQRSVLGYEGDKALAELVARLHNARPYYDKYSKMALNIKNNSFSKVDKDVMHKPYEELNGYLRQFLSKEEFDRAKIEYVKYEKSQIVNGVYARIRNQKSKHNYKKIETSDAHLALQKTANSLVDNYKVGAMAVKNASEGRKQLAILFGDELVPKPVLLDKLEKTTNTVNNAIDAKGMFVKAFSGDWEGAISDYLGKAKEKLIDPLNDCAIGLGSTFTGYKTMKRVFNFKETMTTLVNDTWNGIKDAIQAIERGENPNSVWNRVIIRTEQKDINTINKGFKQSF